MPQNFLGCDREQALLLPPSLRDWLDDDLLAWLVLDVVGEFDLGGFSPRIGPTATAARRTIRR